MKKIGRIKDKKLIRFLIEKLIYKHKIYIQRILVQLIKTNHFHKIQIKININYNPTIRNREL